MTNYIAGHKDYIDATALRVQEREKELAKLKANGSTDVKRIARLEEIIRTMKHNIELAIMADQIKRPYGL